MKAICIPFMGTCGIAAGAREIMAAVLDELAVRKLKNVQVQQTGCIGMNYSTLTTLLRIENS